MKFEKIVDKEISLKCGASITVKGQACWLNKGEWKRTVTFEVTDPNQTFTPHTVFEDTGAVNPHTVDFSVTRKAIPGLIRLLKKVYKQTAEPGAKQKSKLEKLANPYS